MQILCQWPLWSGIPRSSRSVSVHHLAAGFRRGKSPTSHSLHLSALQSFRFLPPSLEHVCLAIGHSSHSCPVVFSSFRRRVYGRGGGARLADTTNTQRRRYQMVKQCGTYVKPYIYFLFRHAVHQARSNLQVLYSKCVSTRSTLATCLSCPPHWTGSRL